MDLFLIRNNNKAESWAARLGETSEHLVFYDILASFEIYVLKLQLLLFLPGIWLILGFKDKVISFKFCNKLLQTYTTQLPSNNRNCISLTFTFPFQKKTLKSEKILFSIQPLSLSYQFFIKIKNIRRSKKTKVSRASYILSFAKLIA